jgi:hypothetical protein
MGVLRRVACRTIASVGWQPLPTRCGQGPAQLNLCRPRLSPRSFDGETTIQEIKGASNPHVARLPLVGSTQSISRHRRRDRSKRRTSKSHQHFQDHRSRSHQASLSRGARLALQLMRKQSFFFRADGFLAHGRNAGVSTPASRPLRGSDDVPTGMGAASMLPFSNRLTRKPSPALVMIKQLSSFAPMPACLHEPIARPVRHFEQQQSRCRSRMAACPVMERQSPPCPSRTQWAWSRSG